MDRESHDQYMIRRRKEDRLKNTTLIAGGCSFTYNNEMTWAGKVTEKFKLINVHVPRAMTTLLVL